MFVDEYVNLMIIAVLLGVGKIVKSAPCMNKVANNAIPFILMVLSVLLTLMLNADTSFTSLQGFAKSFSSGICSAAVAIGLHQSGKNLFISSVNKIDKKDITD